MSRPLTLILALVLAYSCASTSDDTSESSASKRDLSGLKNTDFKPPKEVIYESDEDFFSDDLVDEDVLTRESLGRMSIPNIESIGDSDNPINKAISYCHGKKFNAGFKILDQIYDKYKKHPSYWNQVGSCYLLKGDNKKALIYYNKARELDYSYAPPVNNLGVIYQKEGKEQKAIISFRKAIELNAFSVTPVFNLANVLLKYGFVKDAKELFISLNDKNDEDVDVLNGLAVCNILEGDTKKAIELFEEIDPKYYVRPYIGLNYAVLLKKVGKKDDAMKILERTYKLNLNELRDQYSKVYNFVRN